jgi:hypothetical protein
MGPLRNSRHEAFARALFEGETADAAFVKAGYSKNRGNASRLKANESIQMRIAELQATAAKSSQVTVASLLSELEDARQRATDLKQLSASVRAIESKARISGLLTEKIEIKTVTERYEHCTSVEDVGRVMWSDYRELDGYSLDEKDLEDLSAAFATWWEATSAILDRSKARPVATAEQIQRHELRRLGFTQRPIGNDRQR